MTNLSDIIPPSNIVTEASTDTLTNKTLTSPVLNTGVSGTAVLDEDNMASDSATKLATQQSIKAYVDSQVDSTEFVLEDDDGTEVTLSNAKEVKFIGSGITTNWTDTDNGTDGDPYDLTFSVDAAQTGITSLLATDIKIGEDDQTKIDFETADEIHFYANNVEQVYLGDNIFGPQSDSDVDLGSTGVRWKDAFVDSITVTGEVDAASLDISGNADIDGTLETDNLTVGGAQGSDGQVLTSTGSGVGWEDAAAGGTNGWAFISTTTVSSGTARAVDIQWNSVIGTYKHFVILFEAHNPWSNGAYLQGYTLYGSSHDPLSASGSYCSMRSEGGSTGKTDTTDYMDMSPNNFNNSNGAAFVGQVMVINANSTSIKEKRIMASYGKNQTASAASDHYTTQAGHRSNTAQITGFRFYCSGGSNGYDCCHGKFHLYGVI